jgi:hypothetical protein
MTATVWKACGERRRRRILVIGERVEKKKKKDETKHFNRYVMARHKLGT